MHLPFSHFPRIKPRTLGPGARGVGGDGLCIRGTSESRGLEEQALPGLILIPKGLLKAEHHHGIIVVNMSLQRPGHRFTKHLFIRECRGGAYFCAKSGTHAPQHPKLRKDPQHTGSTA